MTNEEYIKMWLNNCNIEEHAKKFNAPKGFETTFYYQRFLDITQVEVMRILRTKALYEEPLEDEEKELLRACEYAQDKLDMISKQQ